MPHLIGSFAVRAGHDRHGSRLGLVGELDVATADVLAREVRRIEDGDETPVVIDLRELRFLDVMGVRALLDACALLSEHGWQVAVEGAGVQVARVLELTRALHRLPLAT